MPVLHDPQTCSTIQQRLGALPPDSKRIWDKMAIDQILHHVSLGIETALGRMTIVRDPTV